MTTEIDEEAPDQPALPKRRRASRATTARTVNEQASATPRALKRNAAAFVEIVVSNKRKRITQNGDIPTDTQSAVQTRGKGKGKAWARESSLAAVESAFSDALLGANEVIYVESDDSGSEYIASENEVAPSVDEEDEVIILDAAVRMSLQTLRIEAQNGGSSSSGGIIEPSPEVVQRAIAVERRLARNHDSSDFDDFEAAPDSDFELSDSDEYSDSPAVRRRGKGASKTKAKLKTKPKTDVKTVRAAMGRDLSPDSEDRERQLLKAEERALSKKLGRKLTPAEKATVALNRYHPELREVWGDISTIPVNQTTMAPQPENMKLTLLPFQRESLSWMQKQEQDTWRGGILADEMGMGKTIQMISLIVSAAGGRKKPNLVVAPTVAIMQWKHEVLSHTDGLKVLVWHGTSRETSHKELAKYDVVLTTYSILESCFRKQESGFKRGNLIIKEKSPIHQVKWHRDRKSVV